MIKLVISLFLLIFFNQNLYGASYIQRNYVNDKCDFNHPDQEFLKKVDLTSKPVTHNVFKYQIQESKAEANLHQVRKHLARAAAFCSAGIQSACKLIEDTSKSWSEKEYLIAPSRDKSFHFYTQNRVLLILMESLLIAEKIKGENLSKSPKFKDWIEKALYSNAEYKKFKNNHRTIWVIAAMKTAKFFNSEIKIGFNKKNFGELGDWELKHQFIHINHEGALKYEAVRGRRAIFYTGRQLGNLLSILEMMEASGNYRYQIYDEKLHLAVSFLIDAVDNPEVILPYAKKMIMSPDGDPLDQDFGDTEASRDGTFAFIKVYTTLYPEHKNTGRIKDHALLSQYLEKNYTRSFQGFGIDLGCLSVAGINTDLTKINDFYTNNIIHPEFCSGVLLTIAGEAEPDRQPPDYSVTIRGKNDIWFSDIFYFKDYRNTKLKGKYQRPEDFKWRNVCIPVDTEFSAPEEISVRHSNDTTTAGIRNLFVKRIVYDGKEYPASSGIQYPGCKDNISQKTEFPGLLYCAGDVTFKLNK